MAFTYALGIIFSILALAKADASNVRITSITPRLGSTNGATRLTIYGTGFAENQFNFGDGNEHLGNKVEMVSDTQSFDCDIHLDGCTETQIMCYTVAMPEDKFFVRVSVDGERVPEGNHCNYPTHAACRFQPYRWRTPTVYDLTPTSGVPGVIADFRGILWTDLYQTNDEVATNGATVKITRAWFGSQKCDLIDPESPDEPDIPDELYGITLDGETSQWGNIKCRLNGTYVGNMNASFIVDGDFGRSKPELSTMRVTAQNTIAMFQSYAIIDSVSPSTGSMLGGTMVTISGKHFDETDHPAIVTVGEWPCIVKSLKDEEIVCETVEAPLEEAAVHPGNRGVMKEYWNSSDASFKHQHVSEVLKWNESVVTSHLDKMTFFGFLDEDFYFTRTKGFFVPPMDNDYTFFIKGDDSAYLYMGIDGTSENMTLRARCDNYCGSYTKQPNNQKTERMTLEGGKPYYFEVAHKEWVGHSGMTLAAHMHDTLYSSSQSASVLNERQKIITTSTVSDEIVDIVIEGITTQSRVYEVQTLEISSSNPELAVMRIGLNGVYTAPLAGNAGASDVKSQLLRLTTISPDSVDVSRSDVSGGYIYTVTFRSDRGDFDDLVAMKDPTSTSHITFTVTEVTKGVPSMSSFTLKFDGVPSPKISQTANANTVKTALEQIFSVRCPSDLTSPSGKKYKMDFESGNYEQAEEPFCGKQSAKNNKQLYKKNKDDVSINPLIYSKVCFAYRGNVDPRIWLKYTYTTNRDRTVWKTYDVGLVSSEPWKYTCIDMSALLTTEHSGVTSALLHEVKIEKLDQSETFYVDQIYIGSMATTDDFTGVVDYRRLKTSEWLGRSVTVNKPSNGIYNITIETWDCNSNLPLIEIGFSQGSGSKNSKTFRASTWPSASVIKIDRKAAATPPVGGTFDITFKGKTLTGIAANIGADELKNLLEATPGFGLLDVTREGSCAGYEWRIDFRTQTGDQPDIQTTWRDLTGPDANISVSQIVDGGVFFDPIMGDMIRTEHPDPQVVVAINLIPSKCLGDCSFRWDESQTPNITAINPTSGSAVASTTLTITGTGFGTENNTVTIGKTVCDVTSATTTSIECTIGEGPAGPHEVIAHVEGKGYARHVTGTFEFTYDYAINSFSPALGSMAGGTEMTISGTGFGDNVLVFLGDGACSITNATYDTIICITPPGSGNVSVIVSETTRNVTASDLYDFSAEETPIVSSLSDSQGSAAEQKLVSVTGTNFGANGSVFLDSVQVEVLHYNDTHIELNLPTMDPGSYPLTVKVPGTGTADLSINNIPDIEYTLEITDIFPKTASLNGGTKLTITGAGFGLNSDVSVLVGETPCSITNSTDSQIICITGHPGITHEIDNTGVHPDYGKGYAWSPLYLDIEVGDSVEWTWTTPEIVTNVAYKVEETADPSTPAFKGEGFNSGTGTANGVYKYQFNTPGIRYYWSGKVDGGSIYLKGAINVLEKASDLGEVVVTVGNHIALHNMTEGPSSVTTDMPAASTDSAASTNSQTISNSNTTDSDEGDSTTGSDAFSSATTELPAGSTGSNGFSTATTGLPSSSTGSNAFSSATTELPVNSTESNELLPATTDMPSGDQSGCPGIVEQYAGCTDSENPYALGGQFGIVLTECSTPTVAMIQPTQGPATDPIVIIGTGFSTTPCKNEVMIGEFPCIVTSSNATTLVCDLQPGPGMDIGVPYSVTVRVNNLGDATMTQLNDLDRHFVLLPHVDSVSPQNGSISGGTELDVMGQGFSTNIDDMSVTIGGYPCEVTASSYDHIECVTSAAVETTASVAVSVLADGQNIPADACDNCDYTYASSETPTVDAFTPASINASSDILSINGTGFGSPGITVDVHIGADLCNITSLSDTSIECEVKDLVAGDYNLVVKVFNKGKSAAKAATVAPSVNSLTPNSGSLSGGTKITVSGSGFAGDSTVSLGNTPCKIEQKSGSEIVCVSGANIAEIVDAQVTSNGLLFPTLAFEYSSAQTPTVTSVSPTAASSGDTLTITGTGFGTTNADVTVVIDNSPCTVISSVTATSIQCTLGDHSAGTYPVEVSIDGKGDADGSVMFTYEIALDSISPSSGSLAGGQLVTLAGKGFDEELTAVTICNITCVISKNDTTPTSLICETPASSGNSDQTCEVFLSVGSSNDSLPSGFSYTTALTPTITGVNPRRGGTGGGTTVTITGTSFGNTQGDVNVTIGGIECDISTFSATEIVCVTNARKPSIRTKIRVEIGSNGIATQDNADFEYVDLWSSPYSWDGILPVEGDLVVIPSDMIVVLDTKTPIMKMVLIDGGQLIFDNQDDVELQAEYILIANGGLLQIGTEDEPFQHKAYITMHGHVRSQELPIYGSKVLAVREGRLELHGNPKVSTWTRLDGTVNPGDTQITLKGSVDWDIGDEIVIASTGDRHSQNQNEQRTITAISNGGLTLTLNEGLTYEHLGVTMDVGTTTQLEARAEVGRLTRNIVFRGNDDSQWHDTVEACPDGFNTGEFSTQTCFQGRFGEETGSTEFGGHILMHAPRRDEELVIAHIENVEFTFVGQAFKLGRYAIHFHLNGDMEGSYVKHCAIHRSFNRVVNIHNTHNIMVHNNVAFNIMGGAFFLEDGIETGNTFDSNLAVFVKSSTSLQNDDITPAAYWLTNADNTVTNNAAAGGSHFGFWYRMHEHPDAGSFDPNICPEKVPLKLFRNNTVHSQGWFGLWIFQKFEPVEGGGCNDNVPQAAKFEGLITWNCEKGAESVGGGAVQFHDSLFVNNKLAGIEFKFILNAYSYSDDHGSGIYNTIIGATPDDTSVLSEQPTKSGIILPYSRGLLVDGVRFVNFNGGSIATLATTHIDGTSDDDNGGFTTQFKNLVFENSPQKARFRWESENVFHDLDGTLTGITNGKAVATTGTLNPAKCNTDAGFSVGLSGSICDETTQFHRWSFNNPFPKSLDSKDVSFTNAFGSTIAVYQKKRMTHTYGWMALLPAKEFLIMSFINGEHLTNISYTGVVYDLGPTDYVILAHNLTQKPDRFHVLGNSIPLRNSTDVPLGDSNAHGDWYFDEETRLFSYKVAGSGSRRKRLAHELPGYNDRSIDLDAYRCYYQNCAAPVSAGGVDNSTSAFAERPADFVLWHDAKTWESAEDGYGGNYGDGTFGPPKDGDDVIIKEGDWVVVRGELPKMNKLYIYGVLELETAVEPTTGHPYNFTLSCTHILISGGGLIVGWEGIPYLGETSIILRGDHFTEDMPLPYGPNMGAKALGVFGRLDLHGRPNNVHKTKLAASANAGASSITVTDAPDWRVGDQIVVSTTTFNPWETEVFTITSVTGATIGLNSSLAYDHLIAVEMVGTQAVELSCEVGLLTKNIRIIGEDYDKLFEQAFGARVLVGTLETNEGVEHLGNARISNVEFFHCGQEGWTDPYDPRYALAFLNTGANSEEKPSYVKNSTFNYGFSLAIGSFGTEELDIENNVIYRTVGSAIRVTGVMTKIRSNLITLVQYPGTFNGRFEASKWTWDAGIQVNEATMPILTDNVVAGSERSGYHIDGESCTGGVEAWSNNVIRGSLLGIMYLPGDGLPGCTKVSGFRIFRTWDAGVYIQTESSAEITDLISVDNNIGVFTHLIGPSSTDHVFANTYLKVTDSIFIGTSDIFGCGQIYPRDSNFAQAKNSRSWQTKTGGHIGVTMGTFTSGDNSAPTMKFYDLHAYNTIGGLSTVDNVKFSKFNNKQCSGKRDACFYTAKNNDDAIHPMRVSNLEFFDVEEDSKVFFTRPRLETINPSDCIDMDCDGLKKCILEDLDGTLLPGGPGSVISQSEFEWDGDGSRGLGDYRIPNTFLTTKEGTSIPIDDIVDERGIIRDASCTYKAAYQAWVCHDLDYQMMILESMDWDTETRRLSPIGLLGERYMDLINGPQDHGWCMGYTCQKRLSTFPLVVASGKYYTLHFAGTAPQNSRLHFLNTDDTQAVVIGIYNTASRLDIYVNDEYVLPTNGYYNDKKQILSTPPSYDGEWVPNVASDPSGSNYYDTVLETLHVLVRGPTFVEIRTSEQIIVTFTLQVMTVDEFFGENLVANMAMFLGIPPNKIRIAKAVRESGRKRRAVEYTVIELEISDSPAESAGERLDNSQYQNLTSNIVNGAQTNSLGNALNITILSMAVTEPFPDPASDAWGSLVEVIESGEEIVNTITIPSALVKYRELEANKEGSAFPVQPIFTMRDSNGDHIKKLGTTANPWKITATIRKISGSDSKAEIVGSATVKFDIHGYCNFTDLGVSHSGEYIIDFTVTYPDDTAFTVASETFTLSMASLDLGYATWPNETTAVGEECMLEVEVLDATTGEKWSNISWKDHTWTCEMSLHMPEISVGAIEGTLEGVVMDAVSGSAVFADVVFTEPGHHYVHTHCVSNPAQYDISVVTPAIAVLPEGYNLPDPDTAVSQKAAIKFLANFDDVVGDDTDYFAAAVYNQFIKKVNNVTLETFSVFAGSIMVDFVVSGNQESVDKVMKIIWDEVSNEMSVNFNGHIIYTDAYLEVDGSSYNVVEEKEESSSSMLAIIIGVVIGVLILVLVLIIVGVVVYKKKKAGKNYDRNKSVWQSTNKVSPSRESTPRNTPPPMAKRVPTISRRDTVYVEQLDGRASIAGNYGTQLPKGDEPELVLPRFGPSSTMFPVQRVTLPTTQGEIADPTHSQGRKTYAALPPIRSQRGMPSVEPSYDF